MTVENYTRVRVSGALVRDGKMLLVGDAGVFNGVGFHYDLPGGGAEPGEPLDEAIRREMREEADCEVEVGPILAVYQYLARNSRDADLRTPSVGLLFALTLKPGSEPRIPVIPDHEEHAGVHWISLEELADVALNPAFGPELLTVVRSAGAPLFPDVAVLEPA